MVNSPLLNSTRCFSQSCGSRAGAVAIRLRKSIPLHWRSAQGVLDCPPKPTRRGGALSRLYCVSSLIDLRKPAARRFVTRTCFPPLLRTAKS